MIFGTGFALLLVCPILHGTLEPKDGGFVSNALIWGTLIGLALMLGSGVWFAISVLP